MSGAFGIGSIGVPRVGTHKIGTICVDDAPVAWQVVTSPIDPGDEWTSPIEWAIGECAIVPAWPAGAVAWRIVTSPIGVLDVVTGPVELCEG